MASHHKPSGARRPIRWDGLFDKYRPQGPGVYLVSPDHRVLEVSTKSSRVRITDFDDKPYSLSEIGRLFDIGRCYAWVIDLDERGVFKAHVEDVGANIVFSCSNEEDEGDGNITFGEIWLTRDGFMRHIEDTDGLTGYLRAVGVIGLLDIVLGEARFRDHVESLEARHAGGRPPARLIRAQGSV